MHTQANKYSDRPSADCIQPVHTIANPSPVRHVVRNVLHRALHAAGQHALCGGAPQGVLVVDGLVAVEDEARHELLAAAHCHSLRVRQDECIRAATQRNSPCR
eukprot:1160074-Pelagomonas_calceolata.AAC.2